MDLANSSQAYRLISAQLVTTLIAALLLIFLQDKYKLFKFPNPEEYYIDYIPVYMDLPTLLFLNLGVLLLCRSGQLDPPAFKFHEHRLHLIAEGLAEFLYG